MKSANRSLQTLLFCKERLMSLVRPPLCLNQMPAGPLRRRALSLSANASPNELIQLIIRPCAKIGHRHCKRTKC